MAIVKCAYAHFYDDTKYSRCPICSGEGFPELGDFNSQQTQYLQASGSEQATLYYDEMVQDDDKTIMLKDGALQNRKTVGWLVCLDGITQGKSIPFYLGQNFAGRSPSMDIVLTDDPMISRERHFSLVYDPKTIRFFLCAGSGAAYVNDALVRVNTELFDGDIITAGRSSYAFVPYCKKGRVWDE